MNGGQSVEGNIVNAIYSVGNEPKCCFAFGIFFFSFFYEKRASHHAESFLPLDPSHSTQ